VSSPRPELGTKAAERRARNRSFGGVYPERSRRAQDRLSAGVLEQYVGVKAVESDETDRPFEVSLKVEPFSTV